MSNDKTPRQLLASLYSGGVEFTRETFNTLADALSASEGAAPVGLLAAARVALDEMCRTNSPRGSFTEAVDALDAAITAAETPQPAVSGDDQAEVIARLRDDVAMLRETLAAVTKQPAVNGAGLSDVDAALRTFLDAAGGEGLVLGGVDAADLFCALYVDGCAPSEQVAAHDAQARPVADSDTEAMRDAFDWTFCPYKGSPDPWVVWQAAWKACRESAPTAPPAEVSRAEKLRAAGFTRRPSWKSLPSDGDEDRIARPAAPLSEVQLPELPPDGVVKAMQDAWWSGKSAHIMKTTDAYRVYAAVRAAIAATSAGEGAK